MLDADVRFQLNGGEWQSVSKRFTEFLSPPRGGAELRSASRGIAPYLASVKALDPDLA